MIDEITNLDWEEKNNLIPHKPGKDAIKKTHKLLLLLCKQLKDKSLMQKKKELEFNKKKESVSETSSGLTSDEDPKNENKKLPVLGSDLF